MKIIALAERSVDLMTIGESWVLSFFDIKKAVERNLSTARVTIHIIF
jgi:hypothetical protein